MSRVILFAIVAIIFGALEGIVFLVILASTPPLPTSVTQGIVTAMQMEPSLRYHLYDMTVSFSTGGQAYSFVDNQDSIAYPQGTHVVVRFDAWDPQSTARIYNQVASDYWRGAGAFTSLGSVALRIGILVWAYVRAARRTRA